MNDNISIGILGIGAIGSVFAAHLHKHFDKDLHLYSRSAKTDIKLETPEKNIHFSTTIHTSPGTKPHTLNWLIVCLKEYHYADASHWFEALISPDTRVLIVRNGIRLKEHLLPYTSADHLVETMIDCPTQPAEQGGFIQLVNPVLTIPDQDDINDLKEVLIDSGFTMNTSTDFNTENWKKLSESSALGAILCLTGETCHIFKDIQMQDLFARLLDEGLAVAKADGARIPESFRTEMLQKLLSYPPHKGSSMLTDRLQGNPIEVNAKNGIISQIGKQLNVPTPLNDLFTLMLSNVNVH